MFYWDRGVFLTATGLALDVPRRQKLGFVSHAHADHLAAHELTLCTPATAALVRHRLGTHRCTLELPYRESREFGPLRLTTFPAGHCLGSAMLLVESGPRSLLFTGDFKLGPSATAEQAELPGADIDILVMESTFGLPKYRMPPREDVIDELVGLVCHVLDEQCTPVIHAYALGKAQEVTKVLTNADIPVQQHPVIFAMSEVYRKCGVDLGKVSVHQDKPLSGYAVVTLPRGMKGFRLAGIKRPVSIAVTGWATDPSTKYRQGVDYALPLSDHADFDELLQTVELVKPESVYCTHGPPDFVEHLRSAGHNAFPVTGSFQTRMF